MHNTLLVIEILTITNYIALLWKNVPVIITMHYHYKLALPQAWSPYYKATYYTMKNWPYN